MNPTNRMGQYRCFGRVGSSCSTCGTRLVTLVTSGSITMIMQRILMWWGVSRYLLKQGVVLTGTAFL